MSRTKPVVYYDGSCPLCRREIAHYRARQGAGDIDWQDVGASCERMVAPDLARDDAMARFHVRTADGRLESGAAAFATLWAHLPAYRWLGLIAALPVARPLLEIAYRGSLRIRPALQRLFRNS